MIQYKYKVFKQNFLVVFLETRWENCISCLRKLQEVYFLSRVYVKRYDNH
jgi:hypothetical protein